MDALPERASMLDKPLTFVQDDPEKACELLQLSLSHLKEKGMAVNPVNDAVAYSFFSGKTRYLTKKWRINQPWAPGAMQQLFSCFLIRCRDEAGEAGPGAHCQYHPQ